MVFWLAVLVGGLFAWIAVQIGFYATWILFFHVVLSAYVAIFLTPVIVANVPAATTTEYGYFLILMSVAVATLFIAYGICFACLSGQLRVEFPKLFDSIGAGLVGFQAGFLVWSFLALAFCLTPLSEVPLSKTLGFDRHSQKSNIKFVCLWCDGLHSLVSPAGTQIRSRQAIEYLERKTGAAVVLEEPETGNDAEPVKDGAPPPPAPVKKAPPEPSPSPPRAKEPEKPQGGKAEAPVETSPAPKQTSEAPPTPPSPPKIESLEDELARRLAVANAPDELAAAMANQDIAIIQVADACTADKLSPEQSTRLRQWISDGGILWVNNDVLKLLGVQHSRLGSWGGELYCRVSQRPETSPLLADCKKVALKDVGGKAHGLSSRGVVPLLALETDIPLKHPAGTPCWSLVPYGKGWVTDPKPVDMAQYDGAAFWRRFCEFCLKRQLLETLPGAEPAAEEKLAGAWRASSGARFVIADDGQNLTIDLISSDALQSLTGKLVCEDPKAQPRTFAGPLEAVFAFEPSKRYVVEATMTVLNPRRVRLRCENWPKWNNRGKYLGKAALTESWNRSGDAVANTDQSDNP